MRFTKFRLPLVVLLLAAAVLGLTQCTKANLAELRAECRLPENVTYNQHIKPLLETTCTLSGCHVPGVPNLDDYTPGYSALVPLLENGALWAFMVQDPDLSPDIGAPYCEVELWKKWIRAGGPE